jgi:branched-subunit amino acid transport protein AzlD
MAEHHVVCARLEPPLFVLRQHTVDLLQHVERNTLPSSTLDLSVCSCLTHTHTHMCVYGIAVYNILMSTSVLVSIPAAQQH